MALTSHDLIHRGWAVHGRASPLHGYGPPSGVVHPLARRESGIVLTGDVHIHLARGSQRLHSVPLAACWRVVVHARRVLDLRHKRIGTEKECFIRANDSNYE